MKVNPKRSKSIRANTSGLNIQENDAFWQVKFKLLYLFPALPSDTHSPVRGFFTYPSLHQHVGWSLRIVHFSLVPQVMSSQASSNKFNTISNN